MLGSGELEQWEGVKYMKGGNNSRNRVSEKVRGDGIQNRGGGIYLKKGRSLRPLFS